MIMGKSAISLMLFFIFFNLMMVIAKADELAPVIEPPELPGSIESGEQIETSSYDNTSRRQNN